MSDEALDKLAPQLSGIGVKYTLTGGPKRLSEAQAMQLFQAARAWKHANPHPSGAIEVVLRDLVHELERAVKPGPLLPKTNPSVYDRILEDDFDEPS